MQELDYLFNKSNDVSSCLRESEKKRMNNFKLPFGIKLGWKLITSLVLGGVILAGCSLISSSLVSEDDTFITSDEQEKVLLDQFQRYCMPNMLQFIGNGKDAGTCHEKRNNYANYVAAKYKGDQPEMVEDLMVGMSENIRAMKRKLKEKQITQGL